MAFKPAEELDLHLKHAQQRITAFYKFLYQINDLLLGLVFLTGSFLFFNDDTMFAGTVLFVIGSLQMLIRPIVSIVHDIHIKKVRKNHINPGMKA
ncbi:YrhK family protein [Salicibibacter cibi]|uniref:YrhK family protein n=1 Tax=Salicibibacter cibi TaxID=2743001 RepID=A0A7T7CGP3_9BACI|nr:YrhK family protein [Salicibibacter cibi]QQK81239.1 YrhK family protein [Salicibibacter cibi]